MATGDSTDILSRLKSYMPRGWFGDWAEAPVVSAVLSGIAAVFATSYALIIFAWAQTRLQTSSGGWIDLWAADFFGNGLPRKAGETDAAYIARIKMALFQRRATRPAMDAVLTQLTGRAPVIFEPARPLDSGCCGVNTGPASFCGVARMGSIAAPFTALITVYRPQVSGGSLGAAYANAPTWSAMAAPTSHGYAGSLTQEVTAATDADILAAVNATRPAATKIGVCITNYGISTPVLGANFILDQSTLD
ncbi:hypothetical protein [Burkholderia gladioli]|uniref:hypothetical protein n=1 Tax=Burkholderia gladioli TaxID=28095 RepID=UPI00163FC86D|nr:hypothetical protein [Burkholderia gladioli]